MGEIHRHVTDEEDEENLGDDDDDDDEGDDDDDEGDDDVYMYPTDIHLDEQHAYRAAIQASKAIEWNQQEEKNFVRDKRETGICKMEDRLINLNYYCFLSSLSIILN